MGKRSRDALGETPTDGSAKKRKREDKYGKEKKKRLREQKKDIAGLPEEDRENVQVDAAENGEGEQVLSKKALKKRNRELTQKNKEEGEENEGDAEAAAEEAKAEPDDTKNGEAEHGENETEETNSGKKTRFIVFVGMSTSSALSTRVQY